MHVNYRDINDRSMEYTVWHLRQIITTFENKTPSTMCSLWCFFSQMSINKFTNIYIDNKTYSSVSEVLHDTK